MIMWTRVLFLIFFPISLFSQSLETICVLDKKLNEISGLEVLDDSTFLAHNDSGNKPLLFLLAQNGEIRKEVKLANAKNIDWEDITMDDSGNVYLADFGNNLNKRKDLKIYILKADELRNRSEVVARKIQFSYEDQKHFPPSEDSMYYDAEALTYYNGELWIFTKCHTEPYDGKCMVYRLNTKDSIQVASKLTELQLKDRSFRQDAVTAVDVKENTFYVLTYSGVEVFELAKGIFTKKERISFSKWTQKEALCVNGNTLFIADEKVKSIFATKLYQFRLK